METDTRKIIGGEDEAREHELPEATPEPDELETDEPETDREPEAENTLLAKLRRKRQEIGGERILFLDIPGYEDPAIVVRYRAVDWDETARIAKKLRKSKNPRADLYAQCDLLISACDEILIRIPADGEEEPRLAPFSEVFPELGDEPVKFDGRLAQALGFEAQTARQAVIGVFNNDLAVSGQHQDLMVWLQDSSTETERDF